ncbi:hypothetical protein FE257_002207 [Aspergillus nanangensis]|uniref:FAD-binding PCMH-type domain-containing protein n=1 Tax=Aspergillus nanangensis TaxID=2582783 RepID=A0AAD4GP94_ASPNN|nr:hypothetical protein FE257_002207 [Aspergillus nanangensis]
MKVCPKSVSLLGAVQAVCPLSSSPCCTALVNSPLLSQLTLPSSPRFQALVSSHYSTRAQLQPACFLQPESTDQVSQAVHILTEFDDGSPECQFAVRSGGHAPWAGAASIQGGVTIDLSLMNATRYHAHDSTVSIMSGARWASVYEVLKPLGVAVTGGRADTVGVGGLVTGGGMSFFAAQHGFVCDNVLNFEVVLANGTIVDANPRSHTDLYRALKGGSINFGIVTEIVLAAFQQGDLWGGVIQHDVEMSPRLISALVNFTDHVSDDPRASLVSIWQYSSPQDVRIAASGIQYASPIESPAIYNAFLQIPQISNTTRIADIYDLMMETAPPPGKRALFLTLTFKNNPQVLQELIRIQDIHIERIKGRVCSKEWDVISFLQPLPQLLGHLSKKNGGNVLGLDQMEDNHLLYLLFFSWDCPGDDVVIHETGYEMIRQIKTKTMKENASHDFIYLNYAGQDQDPLGSYGEANVQLIRAVMKQYDPTGVFQTQVPGGFKAGL